ncbi:MAG: hypothetical protein NVS1B4_14260 [Gemmatimonadaceae bacterium]
MNTTVVITVQDRSGALQHAERLMQPGPLALQSVAVTPGPRAGTGRMTLVLESRDVLRASDAIGDVAPWAWTAQADGVS